MDDPLDAVVSILVDDAYRAGGSLELQRILALSAKRSLDPRQIATVRQRLLASGVAIERDASDSAPPEADGELDGVPGGWQEAAPMEEHERDDDDFRDVLSSFFGEARDIPLLSREDEVRLARRIQAGLAARDKMEAGPEETHPGLQALVDDGHAAWRELVEANLRLVPYVARKITFRGSLTEEDLFQEGNLGLMHAATKFDGQAGTKFSTYAVWWIWSYMKRGVIKRGRTIRLPAHIADRLPRLRRMRARLRTEYGGRDPSPEDLADHLGWGLDNTWFLLLALDELASIDTPATSDGAPLSERLPARQDLDPELLAMESAVKETVSSVVASLGPRLSSIVDQRFGLSTGIPRTLQEIGEKMGVTRERIRQLEAKALRRLRARPKRDVLQEIAE